MGEPSRRKLQEIKGGSFTLTLPREWVEKSNLRKGMEIIVSEDGDCLKVFPLIAASEPKVVTLNISDFPDIESVKYATLTYYMQGADKINIESKEVMSPDQKRELKNIRMELPGVDVISEGPNSITFGISADEGRFKLDEMISRMASFTYDIHRDSVKSLLELKPDIASEVIERGNEILRQYRAIVRQVTMCSRNPEICYRSGVRDSRELIAYAVMARDLYTTVRYSVYIAKNVISIRAPVSDEEILGLFRNLYAITENMLRLSVESFINQDFEKMLKVVGMMQAVEDLDKRIHIKVLEKIKDLDIAMPFLSSAKELKKIAIHCVSIVDDAANRFLAPGYEVIFRKEEKEE